MTAKQNPQVQATVGLPSADLITYRFDQTDKKFEELNNKLDKITGAFLTKEEAAQFKAEHDKDIAAIHQKFSEQRWAIGIIVAICSVGATVASVLIK